MSTNKQSLKELYSKVERQAHSLRGNPREYQVITGLCPVNVIELHAQKILALLDELDKWQQESSTWQSVAEKQLAIATEMEAKLQAAESRIAELEAREVQLPKPHAHLIWIQAGYAPDDYWDDVAVSHSEKDKCCDGSERYPVYARWEIEEVLAAAGISVKGE